MGLSQPLRLSAHDRVSLPHRFALITVFVAISLNFVLFAMSPPLVDRGQPGPVLRRVRHVSGTSDMCPERSVSDVPGKHTGSHTLAVTLQ